jgi:hypothetical protein
MIAYAGGKNPIPQRRGSNLRPTSVHAKATWASEVPLDT